MPKKSGKPPRSEVYDAFRELYTQLSDAYWAATTIEGKDRLRGVADIVFEILTELNRKDIESRTDEFKALGAKVRDTQKRLDELKKEIDKIIHAVKIATKVAGAIDKVADRAGKFFAL